VVNLKLPSYTSDSVALVLRHFNPRDLRVHLVDDAGISLPGCKLGVSLREKRVLEGHGDGRPNYISFVQNWTNTYKMLKTP